MSRIVVAASPASVMTEESASASVRYCWPGIDEVADRSVGADADGPSIVNVVKAASVEAVDEAAVAEVAAGSSVVMKVPPAVPSGSAVVSAAPVVASDASTVVDVALTVANDMGVPSAVAVAGATAANNAVNKVVTSSLAEAALREARFEALATFVASADFG